MPLYFFNMVDGHVVPDLEGREIAGLSAAILEAQLDAKYILSEAATAGKDVTANRIEIEDADHKLVAVVEFADMLEKEPLKNFPRRQLEV